MSGMATRDETVVLPETRAPLDVFFKPCIVAVIGASRRAGTVGNHLFRNLLREDFAGVVHPVNTSAESIAAVKAYHSILDVPGEVDLALIVVPAGSVAGVLEECGQKGVRGAIIISAGFGESGEEGQRQQDNLVDIAHRYRMRIMGPNCMGVINTAADTRLNATFSTVFPPAGRIAFGTQSGALGLAILEYARTLEIGLSSFASIGNRADVSSNDLLDYWRTDPDTDVILLYVESFGNPRRFAQIARDMTRQKPVVVIKSGRTAAGSRAAASHTGALATADVATEALFEQTGVIRANTLEELFDIANLLSSQPVPAGRRLAILTNGGGPGILTADACAARCLEVPPLSENTVNRLKDCLSPRATLANPVDMTAEASAGQYREALRVLAGDDGCDIVIVIFIPPIVTDTEAVAAAIRDVAPEYKQQGKTLVASFLGWRGTGSPLGTEDECCVPSFTFPEATASALAAVCGYGEWQRRPRGTVPEFAGVNPDAASQIVESSLAGVDTATKWLPPDDVASLLGCYGIKFATIRNANNAENAVFVAGEVGYPVAVKLLSDTISHKSDVGGVVVDVHSPAEVWTAYHHIQQRLAELGRADEMQGVSLQPMISGGVEVIVGMTEDASFGRLMLFGMGGTNTELLNDVTVRLHPLDTADGYDMVRAVKVYRLLEGWRGASRRDIDAVEQLLLRVSAMVEHLPQIAELDLNPVSVLTAGDGCVVVDARILVKQPSP